MEAGVWVGRKEAQGLGDAGPSARSEGGEDRVPQASQGAGSIPFRYLPPILSKSLISRT